MGCVDIKHACEYNFRLLEKRLKIDLFKLDMNILHFGGKTIFP